MSSKLPTVAIETENGPVIINECDYDPESHVLAGFAPASDSDPTPDDAPPMLVSKEGRKYFVVGSDGTKVEVEGIDAKGYGSEADAWAAIMALNTG